MNLYTGIYDGGAAQDYIPAKGGISPGEND